MKRDLSYKTKDVLFIFFIFSLGLALPSLLGFKFGIPTTVWNMAITSNIIFILMHLPKLKKASLYEIRSFATLIYLNFMIPAIILGYLNLRPALAILFWSVIDLIIHYIWNWMTIRPWRVPVVEIDQSTEELIVSTKSSSEKRSEEVGEDSRLDRTTLVAHFKLINSLLSWQWISKNWVRYAKLPFVKVFDFALDSTELDLDIVAYIWFLLAVFLSIASSLFLYLTNESSELRLILIVFWFIISLYPINLSLQTAENVWPHSSHIIYILMGLLSIAGLLFFSIDLVMVWLGMLTGVTLAQGMSVEFKNGRVNAKSSKFELGFVLVPITIGGILYTLIGSYVTPLAFKLSYLVVLILFIVGMIFSILSNNPRKRTDQFTITIIITVFLALIGTSLFIKYLGTRDMVILILSAWLAFSAVVKGTLLYTYRASKSTFSYIFHLMPLCPLWTVMLRILVVGGFVGLMYIEVHQLNPLHGILGVGIVLVALPFLVYGWPFYLIASFLLGIQTFLIKIRVRIYSKQELSLTYQRTIPYNLQGFQLPLPFLPSLFCIIAARQNLTFALEELGRYAKTSFEGNSVSHTFNALAQRNHSIYEIFCWGISNNLVPQLIEAGRTNLVLREAVRLLIALGLLTEDPYITKRQIYIHSKGRDYYIESTQGSAKQSLLSEAYEIMNKWANKDDLLQFSRILHILEISQNSQTVGDLQDAVTNLANISILAQFLPSKNTSHQLSQVCIELKELVCRYSPNTPSRLNAADREWLYQQLHWFEMNEAITRNSFNGLIISFILTRIKEIQL